MLTLCDNVQPRQPAASRLPLHTLIARRPRHRSALETLQQIERVCSITMQLGTPAAKRMDIAAAPPWLPSIVAAGNDRDTNLLLELVTVAFSEAIPDGRP